MAGRGDAGEAGRAVRLQVVVMQPPEWPGHSHPGGLENPALVGGSGSCLGVLPHVFNRVISVGTYTGLYLGRVSSDVPHSDAPVLTLFDGITRRAMAVDLHFLTSSHYGSVTLLLL
jgi:hypothetical protein